MTILMTTSSVRAAPFAAENKNPEEIAAVNHLDVPASLKIHQTNI